MHQPILPESDDKKPEIPTQQITILRLEGVPQALSHEMSADRIHQILRATESGQSDDYLALIRDIVCGDINTLSAFTQRKTRLLSKPWKAVSEIADDVKGKRNVEFCVGQLKGVKGLIPALSHLLDSSLWPVSVVEKVYGPSSEKGVRYRLEKLVPVPHHLLDFRNGILSIKETTPDGVPTGRTMPADPAHYIIHRGHLMQSLPDCWGGPARALLFWWFIAVSARGWWSQGVERNGVPFLIGKYDPSNPADRAAMLSSFKSSARTFGLAISKDTEVQVEKDMASGDASVHQRLLEFAQGQITRLVVGQTMTSTAANTGLGSNQADVQDDVLTDIVQFDAVLLGGTLDDQLLSQIMAINGLDGPVPALSWQITTEDAQGTAKVLETLQKAGIRIKPAALAALSDAVGYPLEMDTAPDPANPDPANPSSPPPADPTNRPPVPLAAAARPTLSGAQDANDAAARAAAPDLALAFRGTLAPVRQLIAESTSPADLENRLAKFYADLPAGRLATLTADALTAHAANAAVAARR